MRVLCCSTHGAGHFAPLAAFIDGLMRAGHEVLVVAPPAIQPTIAERGYPSWPGASPPDEQMGPVWGRVPSLSYLEAERLVIGEIFAGLNVTAMLPPVEAACEHFRPEVILRDPSEFASPVVADRLGIPHVRVGVSLGEAEELMVDIATDKLEARAPGLAQRVRESPFLTLFPAALENAAAPQPPHVHRFRDPATGTIAQELPDWWPGDGRPLVYVSFGSVAGAMPNAPAVYRMALEAVADVPARVLLTTGHALPEDALGDVPDNVHVERWVPQADVLGAVDAVVCHGGSGTTLGTVAAGVPLVVVPLFADQPYNARAVAAAGCGLAVGEPDRGEPPATAEQLRRAVERVLAEETFRRRAQEIAGEIRTHPPTDEALEVLALR